MRTWRDEGREHARHILTQMLLAVNPQTLFRERLRFDGRALHLPDGRGVDLRPRGALRLLAIGKAAGGMAAHAQPWGPFDEAVVIVPRPRDAEGDESGPAYSDAPSSTPHDAGIPGFEWIASDHPEPTKRSVAAGERALSLAAATGSDDVLLVLLSGGASALAEAPSVPLADLRRTTRSLLDAGADVGALNTVRRHLSRMKGGGLLRATRGGRVVLLAISDVAGDDLAALGSGPVSADPTTQEDALSVLEKHGIVEAVPSVARHLRSGGAETLKPNDPRLARVTSCVLASNEDALRAGARAAQDLGYRALVMPEALRGEARACGHMLAREARALAREGTERVAIIAGGETTVRVVGSGRGGRNQELALAAVDGVSGQDIVLASMGTDGVDGPTDAAGAIVDGATRARADALGLDAEHHLQENDAYAFFDALEDLVRTGPTGTNVRDVCAVLIRAQPLSK